MSENSYCADAASARMQNEIVIDLKDLMAELLIKWKRILAFMLIAALLCTGLAVLKNARSARRDSFFPDFITDEDLTAAKEELPADQAFTVEQLFSLYVSGQQQLDKTLDYNPVCAVKLLSELRIFSTIQNVDRVFIDTALTEEDYQAMRDAAPQPEAPAVIYDRIVLSSPANSNPSPSSSAENDGKQQYLVNVSIYGCSEAHCRELLELVEAAFQRKAGELRQKDASIELDALGETFSYDVLEYVKLLNKANLDERSFFQNQLTSVTTAVQTLSAKERAYYDLLIRNWSGEMKAASRVSWKTWAVIGAFLGAMAAIVVLFFEYALNGIVKSSRELMSSAEVLSRVFVKGKKNLFGKWAAGLVQADHSNPDVKADMAATDLLILLEKRGKSALALLCREEDAEAFAFAELVKTRLHMKNGGLSVCVVDPLRSVDELEKASKSDLGVMVVQLKQSRRSAVREWMQLCARYQLPLAGAVTVLRCW